MTYVLATTTGAGLGLVYFGALWLAVRQCLHAPPRGLGVTLQRLGRLALAGLIFLALSQHGLGALLAGLAGFWLARWYVLHRVGGASDG